MAFLLRSRLLGFLLILAASPVAPAAAALAGAAATPDGAEGLDGDPLSVEARLHRIADAVREREGPAAQQPSDDVLASVFVNGPRVGWRNGGWRNGGFWNGGFRNGGGWPNGRNSGFWNGGFRNGGGWSNFW